MKTIGRTDNGQVLVECSDAEVNAFNVLLNVSKGYSTWGGEHFGYNVKLDADTEDVLTAVSDWVVLADKANLLRRLVKNIDEAIQRKTDEPV